MTVYTVSIYEMSLIVTVAADASYEEHIDGLVNSTLQYNPDYKFVIRLINCEHSIIKKYTDRGVQVIADTCNLDKKKTLIKDAASIKSLLQDTTLVQARSRMLYSKFQCYCTHIRFANVVQLLETTDSDVLVVDADTIVRGNIGALEDKMQTHHICIRYSKSDRCGVEFDNEGFIGIKNCDTNRRFWNIVLDHVTENMFDWDSDYHALASAYSIMKDDIELYDLSPKYKDDKLDSDSLVWSGSFSVKDSGAYKDELAKYLTK